MESQLIGIVLIAVAVSFSRGIYVTVRFIVQFIRDSRTLSQMSQEDSAEEISFDDSKWRVD